MSISQQLPDQSTNMLKRLKNISNTKKIIGLGLALVLVLVVVTQARYAVILDGQVVAVASSRQAAHNLVEGHLADLEKEYGVPVTVPGEIKYRPTWKFWVETGDEQAREKLADMLQCNFQATGIYVDGRQVAVVKNESMANQVLDQLLNTYKQGGACKTSFKQNVTKKTVEVAGHELLAPEEALELIRFGGQKARVYEIKDGDTLWDMATAMQVPVEELLSANPDLDPDCMQIGQIISVSRTCPLVDVISTYETTQQEEIPFKVQEKKDSNLYLGESKLVQKGKSGKREVTYAITLENGVEVQKKIVQQKIISEPQNQVVARGERTLLASRGGGRLAAPIAAGVTSGYGDRHGRFHSGVDFAARHGSPVAAAESGSVTRAGYHGSYGLCIDISHGGGVVTRYAHLSSLGVKAGQRVERGQFIGRVGSTGNSTGPHLHFEVIVNGSHKNPMLFI